MLGGVIGLGLQTWGTDVAALKRYWTASDELGYTRVAREPRAIGRGGLRAR